MNQTHNLSVKIEIENLDRSYDQMIQIKQQTTNKGSPKIIK